MAAVKNQMFYNTDQTQLQRLADEYEFLGRRVSLKPGILTVFATETNTKKRKKRRQNVNRGES